MLDKIQSLYKKEFQFTHTAALMSYLGNVFSVLSEDFLKDKDSRNEVIDAICELLQKCKAQPENPSEAQNG